LPIFVLNALDVICFTRKDILQLLSITFFINASIASTSLSGEYIITSNYPKIFADVLFAWSQIFGAILLMLHLWMH
jgi:hypothetical protein